MGAASAQNQCCRCHAHRKCKSAESECEEGTAHQRGPIGRRECCKKNAAEELTRKHLLVENILSNRFQGGSPGWKKELAAGVGNVGAKAEKLKTRDPKDLWRQ